MKKNILFAEVLQVVASETDLAGEVITSTNRTREAVDARYMLVAALLRKGLYRSDVAKFLHVSRQAIGAIDNGFENRRQVSGKWFEMIWQNVCKALEIN